MASPTTRGRPRNWRASTKRPRPGSQTPWTGAAYYAPSAAAARMARAVATDSGQVVPACAWLTGQYGICDVYPKSRR
jgi:hypothetical protein